MRILGLISFIIILSFGLYNKANQNRILKSSICQEYNRLVERSINVIVWEKYRNPDHHMRNTIKYKDINNLRVLDIHHDVSGFYDFIEKGDSLNKERMSPYIEVYWKGKKVKTFKIDFGCREKNKTDKMEK